MFMATKKRMTAQSKANIGAAASAHIEPNNGGYSVVLTGKTGKTIAIHGGDGPIVYSSMAAAKKAVASHNSQLIVELQPEI